LRRNGLRHVKRRGLPRQHGSRRNQLPLLIIQKSETNKLGNETPVALPAGLLIGAQVLFVADLPHPTITAVSPWEHHSGGCVVSASGDGASATVRIKCVKQDISQKGAS
jgi:hypothetical protein